ncbi:Uncharacterised protein [Mycobacteroides abscessus subsp. abscessus]|nr:Uncharacterised protein [Mycobacteroides abscessus subsp. abscessus]
MPMRRSTQLAVPFSARIAKAKTAENSTMGPEVARDVQTGRASAKFLGTSSPKIIDIDVAMINASASDIAPVRRCRRTRRPPARSACRWPAPVP